MKIAIVIISEQFAGAESVVKELADQLTKHNEITLICNSDLQKYYANLKGLRLIVLPYSLRKVNVAKRLIIYMRCALYLRRHFALHSYEIVSLHLLSSILAYRIAGFVRKTCTVITLHGGEIRQFKDNKSLSYKLLIRPVLKSALEHAAKLTTISDWQVESLDINLKKKTVKIPNGVNTKLFNLSGSMSRAPTVLFVGRMIEIKGIRETLDAAKKLPDVKFLFVGQGGLSNEISGSNVEYLGFMDQKELPALYRRSTVCIFPSYREAFALVGLEAMACGRPIICTPKGFSEYAVDGENSLIIKPRSAIALKEAIEKILSNKVLYERLCKNARQTALQYDWVQVAERYQKVFAEVSKSKEQ
jgi:glycosyltransferase involved in cell wall biosynthesis